MKILALINEKGGTGKSTLSQNIAVSLHRAGKRVILVDADPQGTTRDWRSASPEDANLPNVIALDRPEMLASLKNVDADIAIIDTPAKAEKMTASVIRHANAALIVIQPSGADIWASAAAVRLIQQKQELGGDIKAAFVTNRVSGSSNLSREVLDGEWNEYGIEQLNSTIGNRVAFAQALTDGLSIYETKDGTGKAEIDLLVAELEEKLCL